MGDNPYQSPQSDLTPPDLRLRRDKLQAWLKDRLLLVLTGCGVFAFIMVVAFVNNSAAQGALAVLAIIAWWSLQNRLFQKKTPQ
ncbi:MAG: hypothetical protein SGJ19_06520 [Planctomycetia bacterium]|nr:hypothetical protein [Planctomycetia bacterium]